MQTTPKQQNIVILTGAGISAESGIQTFRGSDGLWEGHRVEEVASPAGFAKNPDLVQHFYNLRRAQLATVEPNAAHFALAKLEAAWQGNFLLVTQNVDDLHQRAGSRRVLPMHGQLRSALCTKCHGTQPWLDEITRASTCQNCQTTGSVRPDIVWFGEMPYQLEEIYEALGKCNIFISIGTSGNVYPAAGFAREAKTHGARTIELNLDPSSTTNTFDECRHGPATELVPEFVRELLG